MPTAPARELREELIAAVTVGAVFFAVTLGSVALTGGQENVAALRLGGAVLLGVLLRRPPARPWLFFASSFVALFAAVSIAGRPWVSAAVTTTVRIGEIALAYALLRPHARAIAGLSSLAAIARVGVVAVLATPLLGGIAGAGILHLLRGTSFTLALANWWMGNAFGMLAVLPLVLAWSPERVRSLRAHAGRGLVGLVATLTTTAVALEFMARPFVVLALPLVLVALTLGLFETTLVCALNAVLVVTLRSLDGLGVLHVPGADHLGELSHAQVQFFCAVGLVAPLTVSVLNAQREEAARLLAESEARIQAITDNIPALIGYLDADLRYRFNNLAYESWMKLPRSAYAGRTPAEVYGDDVAAPMMALLSEVLTGGRQEFERTLPTGRVVSTVLVPDERDGAVHGVYLLSFDVTERRATEEALFREKERAEVTLRSIGDGVVTVDLEGRVDYLNPVAEMMTGWPLAEARGRPSSEVMRLVDEAGEETGLSPLKLAMQEDRILGLASDALLLRRDGYRSAVEDSAAPIHDRDGKVIGGVMVFHDVSEARAMSIKMSHLAQHDHLTGLPNRILLQDRFAQAVTRAKRESTCLALMFLDLDGFKHINDSLGHEVGDQLLKEITARLTRAVRASDTVSRQGGDEFVILLPRVREVADAAVVADKLLEAARRPVVIDGAELNVTLSIGVSLYPNDGTDPAVLMKHADAAMYQAKQGGRDQCRFYTPEISERADRRLSLESSLHQALRNREFTVHYQPKVGASDAAITGMEALVRWRRPTGEVVPPGEFIHIAEESGLIGRVDLWVLEEACRQNRAWQDAGLVSVPVAVNLSMASLEVDRFLEQLGLILDRTGLAPEWLEIEFTESQMLKDTARFERLIAGVTGRGVKVAIDDFGTGYSSLSYLCRYPFNILKIDRSFVNDLGGGDRQVALVDAIVRMADALGYRVVAEGVETPEQEALLRGMRCHELQGYRYSRPVPPDEFVGLLRRRSIVPGA